MTRSHRILAAAALLAAVAGGAAHAQPAAYPTKTVTVIVPAPPGGGSDLMARMIAERLAKSLGQPFIIDNKPGANGMLGVEAAARAAPDGYTLLFSYTAAMVVNPHLYAKVRYDTLKDFAPVVQIGRAGNLMLVRSDFQVKTVKEWVDYAKARPGKVNYCTWGNGSGGHLTMESLAKQAGLTLSHVPYKGVAPCIQDLLGGQIDVAWGDVSSTLPHVRSGKLRALVSSAPARLSQLPEVPTMKEAGFTFTTYTWYGIFAPARTPAPIVARINTEVNKMFTDPATQARFHELNFDDLPANTPEQFAATVRSDFDAWGALVKQTGVKLD